MDHAAAADRGCSFSSRRHARCTVPSPSSSSPRPHDGAGDSVDDSDCGAATEVASAAVKSARRPLLQPRGPEPGVRAAAVAAGPSSACRAASHQCPPSVGSAPSPPHRQRRPASSGARHQPDNNVDARLREHTKPSRSSHQQQRQPWRLGSSSHSLSPLTTTTASSSASAFSTPLCSRHAFVVLLLVLSLLSSVAAAASPGTGSSVFVDRRRSILHDQAAERSALLIDRSERPVAKLPRMLHRNHKRQSDDDEENDDDSSGSTTAGRPSSTAGLPASIVPPSGTSTPSTTVNVDDSLQTASPLPEPFDTSLGKNFTNQGCPDFFSSFLNNDTFQSCMPFSLLLQTSQSFFDASKSSFRITQTLDATCRVDFDTCNVLMDSLAHDIKDDSNCGNDFRNENPMVIQAYDGFVAYRLLYQAGCLKDDRGSYCYANAITNTSSATDSYPYYLPLGVALPGGSRPTCNDCLQRTMEIFSLQAGNETQPVSQTYGNAAQQINMGCGPEFVNTTITDVSDAAVRVAPGQGLLAVLSALLVVGWLM